MADRKQTPDILGAILGGAAAPEPPAPAPASTRQTHPAPISRPAPEPAGWQYMVVSFQDYRGWRPRYIDGSEVEAWTGGPLLHEYLAQLGEEGWELAGACSGQSLYGAADFYQLYFKRSR